MRTYLPFAALALASLPLACGGLSDGKPKVLATINGELVNPQSLSFGGATRIAVLWKNEEKGHHFTAAVDLPVQPKFPSQFVIQLTSAPPLAAMIHPADTSSDPPSQPPSAGPTPTDPDAPNGSASPSGGVSPQSLPSSYSADFAFAYGSVVAYEDLNGNGQLDLVDDKATSFVDRIVGANQEMNVVYLEGTLPAEATSIGATKGYGLIVTKSCPREETLPGGVRTSTNDAASGNTGAEPGVLCDPGPKFLPISTLYTLPVVSDPQFNRMMCSSNGSDSFAVGGVETPSVQGSSASAGSSTEEEPSLSPSGGTGSEPQEAYPSPNDPKLHCAPDGRSFSYDYGCPEVKQSLCEDVVVACASGGSVMLPAGGTAPANWPCPVTNASAGSSSL